MRKVVAMARESRRKREERRYGRPERLADLALTTGPGDWSSQVGKAPDVLGAIGTMQRDIAKSPVISARKVSDYFYEHPRHEWTYKTDFPNLAPPFRMFFVEMGKPPRIMDGQREVVPEAGTFCPERFGSLVVAEEVNGRPVPVEAAIERCARDDVPTAVVPEAHWLYACFAVYEWEGRPVYTGNVQMFHVRKDGQILCDPFSLQSRMAVASEHPEAAHEFSDSCRVLLLPTLLAICFMNCRNVTTTAIDPDPQVNRERRKAGLVPFVRYHEINIEPMKQVLRTEGNVESEGLARALHICRGHFKHYGETFMGRPLEKPLTVWCPPHVRGSLDKGVVVSDYDVHAPKPG